MKRRGGLTLPEVLVAAFIFLMISLLAESVMSYIQRVGIKARAQLEPRQQVRSVLANLSKDLRQAAYIYQGFSGSILGTALTVPHAGAAGPALVFAVPEQIGSDLGYRVCAVFARPRSAADPNNPAAREIVYHSFDAVVPSPPEAPGAIDPGSLTGGTTKTFDTYLEAGSPLFRITPNGQAASVRMRFTVKPMRGPVVSESFETLVTLRNNV